MPPSPPNAETEYAGFWRRFAAYLLDTLILAVPVALVIFSMRAIAGVPLLAGEAEVPEFYGCIEVLIVAVMVWLYFAIFESSWRQATPGKLRVGIKVTDLEGRRISFGRATGRLCAKILSALPFYIGFIMAGFTRRKQALHDMLARTLVVDS